MTATGSGPRPLDTSWPLIGRAAEIARACRAIEQGSPCVVIYGGSGIGKSRVADAVGEHLAADGWLVLTASGNPALAAVPFATFAPAIARGVEHPPLPATTDPLTLFTMTNAIITDLAAGRRVLLVLDDVAASDTVSTMLVAQLVAAGRMQVVATATEGEPLPDGILPVAGDSRATRLDLAALDTEVTGELLGAVLGAPLAHRDVVTLHNMARGNPLYLRELLLGAHDSGTLAQRDGVWHLTSTPLGTPALRDLIRNRLGNLGADERDAIERLALCQPLSIREFTRPGALEALASLEDRAIVRVDESGHGVSLTLAHPHYAYAVRESIPRIRAISLLTEQADIVEQPGMHVVDELRVASWRLEAGQMPDAELLTRSAEMARRARDLTTAARLASAAVQRSDATPEALVSHAEIMWEIGRSREALASLDRAEALARDTSAPDALLGAIATKRAEVFGTDPLGSERGIRLLEEVEQSLASQRPFLLLAKSGLVLHLLRANDALAYADEAAVSIGGNPAGDAIVAITRAMPLSYLHRADEAIAAARYVVAHSAGPEPVIPLHRARMVLSNVLIDADQLAEARTVAIDSLHESIREDDRFSARLNEWHLGRIFWMQGRLDAAARWVRDTISGAELYGPTSLRSPALALLAIMAAQQGDLERAREARARLDPGYDHNDSLTALADAWILRLDGETDAAAAILLDSAERAVPRGAYSVASGFLFDLARLGSREYARQAAEQLEALGAVDESEHRRLRAAHARAEADRSACALRAAGAEWEAKGMLLFAAEAFSSASEASAAAGSGREATTDRQRAAGLIAACEGAQTPLLQFTGSADPLTPREREIAALAAQGLSSNEIAKRLYLSPRTVNNHLQSSYTKLGIRSRRELA